MRIDVIGALGRLAARRPLFHSEADFQHALAWQIQSEYPEASVRLETRPERGIRLDLLVSLDDERLAVELKYLLTRFRGEVDGERYDLPNQGAHDISRHDVIKDIVRVERFVRDGVADVGWAITLTNDSNYWRPGAKVDPVDAMFRIHDGRELKGELSWAERAGAGTSRGREVPLVLDRIYACHWKDYSRVEDDDRRFASLRYLAIEVTRSG